MQSFFTRARVFLLAMALIFSVLGTVGLFQDAQVRQTETSLIAKHQKGIGMLTEQGASQSFTAGEENLAAVSVMFSNYSKKVKAGTLTLWLLDEDGALLASADYPVGELRNNAYVTLTLPKAIGNSAGKRYTLHISSNCTEQKGVTVRMGELDAPAEGTVLTLPDGTSDSTNAMCIRLTYENTVPGTMAAFTCWLVALCFVACLPLAGRKERRHA